jgi:hypothetical protein
MGPYLAERPDDFLPRQRRFFGEMMTANAKAAAEGA